MQHPGANPQSARDQAFDLCRELANAPEILERFADDCQRSGLVGDLRPAKLLYLVLTTRLFSKPVSSVVKGPSSAGKSFLTESVLKFFPPSSFYSLTGMSEKALVYGGEPLKHRFIVIAEASGLAKNTGAYLMRSLISEGKLRYETVVKDKDGLHSKMIEREGPTGLLVTTTLPALDGELETRLFSFHIDDTRGQTRAIMVALADDSQGSRTIDYDVWRSFQLWIELGQIEIVIPFAERLARAIPPVTLRLRRDFSAILSLVKAHALLHQLNRQRDAQGRIIATVDDYAVVYELVADLVAQGAQASVSPIVRETVEAVEKIVAKKKAQTPTTRVSFYEDDHAAKLREVAEYLQLDKSSASRRLKVAIELGYVVDYQRKKGMPMQLMPNDPLPTEVEILPAPDVLRGPE